MKKELAALLIGMSLLENRPMQMPTIDRTKDSGYTPSTLNKKDRLHRSVRNRMQKQSRKLNRA